MTRKPAKGKRKQTAAGRRKPAGRKPAGTKRRRVPWLRLVKNETRPTSASGSPPAKSIGPLGEPVLPEEEKIP